MKIREASPNLAGLAFVKHYLFFSIKSKTAFAGYSAGDFGLNTIAPHLIIKKKNGAYNKIPIKIQIIFYSILPDNR